MNGVGAMALEHWQKIVDIALKGMAATALAAGGLYVSLQKNSLDKSEKCSAMVAKLYDSTTNEGNLDTLQRKMNQLIHLYELSCEEMPIEEVQFLKANITPRSTHLEFFVADSAGAGTSGGSILPEAFGDSTSAPSLGAIPAIGWVAVGRIGGTYGQINFDNAEPLLARPVQQNAGLILKARWQVNLRENTENTQQGNNSVVRVIDLGECVLITKAQETRGQVWAQVEVTECPPS
jgi:hypothetical protein